VYLALSLEDRAKLQRYRLTARFPSVSYLEFTRSTTIGDILGVYEFYPFRYADVCGLSSEHDSTDIGIGPSYSYPEDHLIYVLDVVENTNVYKCDNGELFTRIDSIVSKLNYSSNLFSLYLTFNICGRLEFIRRYPNHLKKAKYLVELIKTDLDALLQTETPEFYCCGQIDEAKLEKALEIWEKKLDLLSKE
jgi:hypothetical protein